MEAGFEQRQEQDVSVGAGGFEGDGDDAALSQPGDQLAQAGRVGGKLADGGVAQADPAHGEEGGRSRVLGLEAAHEDIFATPADEDLDLGDDEFDVPSFLR